MSESVTASAATKPGIKPNQAMIVGRIDNIGGFDSNGKRVHEARVKIAAADVYSMPGAVVLQSTYKLGSVGDDVKVMVDITGFPDRFTNKTTGEVTQTARNVLRVSE